MLTVPIYFKNFIEVGVPFLKEQPLASMCCVAVPGRWCHSNVCIHAEPSPAPNGVKGLSLRIRRGLKNHCCSQNGRAGRNLISTAGPDGACLAGDVLRGSPGGRVNLKLKFCAGSRAVRPCGRPAFVHHWSCPTAAGCLVGCR